MIQFPASEDLDIIAEFQPGNGGDVLIDDFNDQNEDSLLVGSSGEPKQWTGRIRFAQIAEGDYALTGGYSAFSLGRRDRRGTVEIPEGTTVFKFRVYNIDEEKEANVGKRGEYAGMRRASYLKWDGREIAMWYSEPLRFPVIPAGESAVMEIPLALLENAEMTRRARAKDRCGELFTFYYFSGYYPESRSELWKAHIAVDNVSFGRACAGPITAPNLPPVANAGRDQIAKDIDGDGKELVWLNGYDSYDQNGGLIASWLWTEDGKELAEGFAPGVDLPVGEHTLTLTVKDEAEAVAEDSVTIAVLGKEE